LVFITYCAPACKKNLQDRYSSGTRATWRVYLKFRILSPFHKNFLKGFGLAITLKLNEFQSTPIKAIAQNRLERSGACALPRARELLIYFYNRYLAELEIVRDHAPKFDQFYQLFITFCYFFRTFCMVIKYTGLPMFFSILANSNYSSIKKGYETCVQHCTCKFRIFTC